MSLLQQIKDASLEARKTKDPSATFLVTLFAEANRVGKDKGQRDSTDEEVIAVLKKFKEGALTIVKYASTRDDAMDQISNANQELELVERFMPKQLTRDELAAIINGYVLSLPEVSAKSMGPIMGKLKQEYAGLYDGNLASLLVKEILSV